MSSDAWFEANRRNWDERVPIHRRSAFYDVPGFLGGQTSLEPDEPDEVGDVTGKSLLHLQCHFGMDTLSWARLGANVTGLDFSPEGVAAARELAAEAGIDAEFVEANVYDAPEVLAGRTFDIVYTSRGVLVWLPDLPRWAGVVAALLKPGGFLYLREGHPFSHVFDDEAESGLSLRYPYFHGPEPDRWDDPGTYADVTAETTENETYEWSHSMGSIVTAIAEAGLVIEFLHEFDHLCWQQLPWMEPGPEPGTWVLPGERESIPLMYSLRARKPS